MLPSVGQAKGRIDTSTYFAYYHIHEADCRRLMLRALLIALPTPQPKRRPPHWKLEGINQLHGPACGSDDRIPEGRYAAGGHV